MAVMKADSHIADKIEEHFFKSYEIKMAIITIGQCSLYAE